ncbi:MAG: hypothetical protein APR63_14460 [Desulfuromonas sp. SDB]|nr:MAG: hypothetical protein APR63_14460 [Desulfuromonas sp. SDB]
MSYHRAIPIILMILLIAFPLCSETWERTFGGERWDAGFSIRQASDSGFIVVGITASYTPFPYHEAMLILKLDYHGDTDWYRIYGGWGAFGNCVRECPDGGYIISGYNDGVEIYCQKINYSGDSVWARYYGTNNFDRVNQLCIASNNGYAIVGFTDISLSDADHRIYLIRIDSVGDTLWTRMYGSGYSDGEAVHYTPDGGFIITGWIYPTGYYDNIVLVKTDSAGDTLWTRMYGDKIPSSDNRGYDIDLTDDGGYVVIGSVLLKTDSLGDSLWAKPISGIAGQQTSDGGFIVLSTVGTYPATDIGITKTDSLGNIQWERTFGGTGEDRAYSIHQATDGGFIISGLTYSYGAGEGDVYVIKTDSMGLVGVEEDPPVDKPISNIIINRSIFSVSDPYSTIVWSHLPQTGKLRIYSITGSRIWEKAFSNPEGILTWDISENLLSNGQYFYQVYDSGMNRMTAGKFQVIE